MDVKLVCIDDDVFKAMVDTIVRRIKDNLPEQDPEFVDEEGACAMLGCKRTKLFKLLSEGKIKKSQENRGFQLMVVTKSIREYQRSLIQ